MPPNNIACRRIVTKIVRLRAQIDEVTPAVIRVVEVPAAMRLDDLHFVLQIAIGWQNCHPFEFGIGDKTWGLIDRDAEENPLPAELALLLDVIALGSTFTYSYVFGDDWHHTVEVEAVADVRRRLSPADRRRGAVSASRYRRSGRLWNLFARDRRSGAPSS